MAPVLVLFFLLEAFRDRRAPFAHLLGAAVALGAGIYFLADYVPLGQTEAVRLTPALLWQVPAFAAALFGRAFGAARLNALTVLGLFAFLGTLFVAARAARDLARKPSRDARVLFLLSSFTVLFAVSSALGRIPGGGVGAGVSSRYVPYVVPGLLALLLFFAKRAERPGARRWVVAALVFFCLQDLLPKGRDTRMIAEYSTRKAAWARCYLEREDAAGCDAETGFPLHPHPETLRWKMEFLKTNRLGLFAPGVRFTPPEN